MNSNATTSGPVRRPVSDGTYTGRFGHQRRSGPVTKPFESEVNSGGQKHTVDVPENRPREKDSCVPIENAGDRGNRGVEFLNELLRGQSGPIATSRLQTISNQRRGNVKKKTLRDGPTIGQPPYLFYSKHPKIPKTSFESAAAAVMGPFRLAGVPTSGRSQSEIDRFGCDSGIRFAEAGRRSEESMQRWAKCKRSFGFRRISNSRRNGRTATR